MSNENIDLPQLVGKILYLLDTEFNRIITSSSITQEEKNILIELKAQYEFFFYCNRYLTSKDKSRR
jgi:hypothetical protein